MPPSKATMAAAAAANGGNMASARDAANTEARRPKHVVLADTIALLKQLAQRVRMGFHASAAGRPVSLTLSLRAGSRTRLQPVSAVAVVAHFHSWQRSVRSD